MGDTKFRQTGRRTAQGPYRRDAKDARRSEGAERNAVWAALPPKEKLKQLSCGRRPGKSARQVKKLQALDV